MDPLSLFGIVCGLVGLAMHAIDKAKEREREEVRSDSGYNKSYTPTPAHIEPEDEYSRYI